MGQHFVRRSSVVRVAGGIGLAVLVLAGSPTLGQTPKSGGGLSLRLREDLPQGFAIHESATISTMWPAMPCLSNLVLFDPLKPQHSVDTIIGELADRWAWQENYKKLVFVLRKDVTWHDGKPFSSKDVKYTFDMLREAPGAPARLRLNARREWYTNVEAVEAVDPQTVVFRLKHRQPSFLLMLASGFTPIYAAHVPPASYRTGCVGTGPFKVKDWRKGEFVEYVKNPDYFVKGRPYLDRLRYLIIAERSTATAALQTGRVDVAFPGETPKPIADQLKTATPQLVITQVNSGILDHLTINTRKPPFDNLKVRQALSRAIDRRALVTAVYQGGAVLGSSMMHKPYGVWGILETDLRTLPGYGELGHERAKTRTFLAEAGFGPSKPMKVEVLTRRLPAFVDLSSFVIGELQRVGIDASLRQVDSPQWGPLQTRGEFEVGVDRNGVEPDDPDANFYEHFGCQSPRAYTGYCSEEITRLVDQQSQELDPKKRLALVQEIQRKLEEAAVRPGLVWRLDYFTVWPHVKNLVPHHSIYSWGRMQEVWLDK
jgi:peptide/nickel transport system substrate-binding protein